jgi:uncharacterized membrane protein
MAVVVVVAIGVLAPPVDDATIRSLVPWFLTTALLQALPLFATPLPLLAPVFQPPAVYLAATAVAGLVWIGTTMLALLQRQSRPEAFLSAWGWGMVLVLGTAVGWRIIATPLPGMGVIFGLVIAVVGGLLGYAAAVTAYESVADHAGVTASLMLGGHAIAGVIGPAAGMPVGYEPVVGALPALPVDDSFVYAGVRVLAAVAALVAAAAIIERNERPGYGVLIVAVATGVVPGLYTLLVALT